MPIRLPRLLVPILLFIVIMVAIPHLPVFWGDNLCWQMWSTYNFKHGLGQAYSNDNNYMPLYQYVLYVYGALCGNEELIYANSKYLKLLTVVIDWLGLWYIYKWTGKKIELYWLILISIINLAYSYNTLLWGQIDGIVASFILMSAYYGYHKKSVLSAVFFVLALNTKLQAVIFLPVWFFFYLQQSLERRSVSAFLYPLFSISILQVLILLPFRGQLQRLGDIVKGSVGHFPFVSLNAFNNWHLALGENVWELNDEGIYLLSLSYRQFGLYAFFLSSFFVLLPWLVKLLRNWTNKNWQMTVQKERVWTVCSLLGLVFFFFNTQMHERYSHPAFIFITAYAIYKKDFVPYVIFSFAYFLNLENVMKALRLNNYDTLVFDPRFIAGLYLMVIIYLFYRLYVPGKAVK